MRLLVANARSGPSRQRGDYAAFTRGLGAFALHSEAHEALPALRREGLQVFAGDGDGKGPRECAVTLPPHVTVLSAEQHKLTRFVSKRNSPDRWAAEVRCVVGLGETARRVALFSVHANAAIRRKPDGGLRGSEGAQEWGKRGLPKLKSLAEFAQADGFDVVAGGDFNWRKEWGTEYSPAVLFTSLGLRFFTTELMWAGWSPAWEATNTTVLPAPPGSDHKALLVNLEPVASAPPQPVPDPTAAHVSRALAALHTAGREFQAAGLSDLEQAVWSLRAQAKATV